MASIIKLQPLPRQAGPERPTVAAPCEPASLQRLRPHPLMSAFDALVHLVNLVLPALLLGGIAALLAKLVWLRALAGVPLLRLAGWASAASVLALVAGLFLTGRDGAMVTYAAMLVACAAALSWAGWGRR